MTECCFCITSVPLYRPTARVGIAYKTNRTIIHGFIECYFDLGICLDMKCPVLWWCTGYQWRCFILSSKAPRILDARVKLVAWLVLTRCYLKCIDCLTNEIVMWICNRSITIAPWCRPVTWVGCTWKGNRGCVHLFVECNYDLGVQ